MIQFNGKVVVVTGAAHGQGAAEVALATNYAFRGEQAALSSFNNWALDDDQGSLAVCNMTITTNPTVNSSCTTTSGVGVWSNTSVAVEQASFSATYDATPVQAAMDGSVGFSSGAATGYASLATITRFNPSGFIDVRNGANYAAAVSVPYTAGTSYHFRMSINPATRLIDLKQESIDAQVLQMISRRRAWQCRASAANCNKSRWTPAPRHWRRHRRRAKTPPTAAHRWRAPPRPGRRRSAARQRQKP